MLVKDSEEHEKAMKDTNTYPKLDSFDKKNPFSTPEGYFESFEEKMMAKINEEKPAKPKVIQMVKPYLYIAAGFLLLFTIGITVLKPFADKLNPQLATHTIIVDEDIEFMLSQPDDYSILDLYSVDSAWFDQIYDEETAQ